MSAEFQVSVAEIDPVAMLHRNDVSAFKPKGGAEMGEDYTTVSH